MPSAAAELDVDQRRFLARLAERARAEAPSGGDAWQALIFAVATERGPARPARVRGDLRAFLGRTNGPRAGWLLASLDPVFVVERVWEASGWTESAGQPGPRRGG